MDGSEPPSRPDPHDLTRQLAARKIDLIRSGAREADLRWSLESLKRELDVARSRAAALETEAEAASERFEAMRTLLDACAASAGPFGLRRRRFLALVRQAAQALPDDGPRAVRHGVLLAEARRLLARRAG